MLLRAQSWLGFMVSKGAKGPLNLKTRWGMVQDAELGLFFKMGKKDGCENSEVYNSWKYLKNCFSLLNPFVKLGCRQATNGLTLKGNNISLM